MITSTNYNYNYNYYNIIPILLIEIIIVYIFEYLVFIFHIIPGVMSRINELLAIFSNNIYYPNMNVYHNDGKHQDQISNSNNNETKYIKTQNTYGIVTFSFIIVGILLLLLLYKYIVVNIMNKKIEWITVGIVVAGITFFILFMESIYIFVIEDQIENSRDIWDMFITVNNSIESYLMKL